MVGLILSLLSWIYLTIKQVGINECNLEEYRAYEKTRLDIEKKTSILITDYNTFVYSNKVDCSRWLSDVIPDGCSRLHSHK